MGEAGAEVLQPCATAGHTTMCRGVGTRGGGMGVLTTIFCGKKKVDSFCSVFKEVDFHYIVYYLDLVL